MKKPHAQLPAILPQGLGTQGSGHGIPWLCLSLVIPMFRIVQPNFNLSLSVKFQVGDGEPPNPICRLVDALRRWPGCTEPQVRARHIQFDWLVQILSTNSNVFHMKLSGLLHRKHVYPKTIA